MNPFSSSDESNENDLIDRLENMDTASLQRIAFHLKITQHIPQNASPIDMAHKIIIHAKSAVGIGIKGLAELADKLAMHQPSTQDIQSFTLHYRIRLLDTFNKYELRNTGIVLPGRIRSANIKLADVYTSLRLGFDYDPNNTKQGDIWNASRLLDRIAWPKDSEKEWLMTLPPFILPEMNMSLGLDGLQRIPQDSQLRPNTARLLSGLSICGAPGSGKTTWIRHAFHELLREEKAFPILIELRSVAEKWINLSKDDANRSIEVYLSDWLKSRGIASPELFFELLYTSDTPFPVLLIDGWDELGNLGNDFRERLFGFQRSYPRLIVIATSRPYGEGRPDDRDGFLPLYMQPLAHEEIIKYTERFFGAINPKEDYTEKIQQFKTALNTSPNISEMAKTPLLLTMMLIIHHEEQIPNNKHQLYEKCLNALLNTLPDERDIEGVSLFPKDWKIPNPETRRNIVSNLAYKIQVNFREQKRVNGQSIAVQRKSILKLLPKSLSSQDRELFLLWLGDITGIVSESLDGMVTFTHLSFQEFFAAWYLHNESKLDKTQNPLKEFAYDVTWWETLRLCLALIEDDDADHAQSLADPLYETEAERSLLAILLADGLLDDANLNKWSSLFAQDLITKWPEHTEICLNAWAACPSHDRRDVLENSLINISDKNDWRSCFRVERFKDKSHLTSRTMTVNPSDLRQAPFSAVHETKISASSIALGRIIYATFAAWPDSQVGLLDVWPSQRRLIGLTLQTLAAFSGCKNDLCELLRHIILSPSIIKNYTNAQKTTTQEPVQDIVSGYYSNIRSISICSAFNIHSYSLPPTNLRSIARIISENLLCQDINSSVFDITSFFNSISIDKIISAVSVSTESLHDYVSRHKGSLDKWKETLYNLIELNLINENDWRQFLIWELSMILRSFTHILLGSRSQHNDNVSSLMYRSCMAYRFGNIPKTDQADNPNTKKTELPHLWLSLASHIIGQADDKDRVLLTELAMHPERCHELSPGLPSEIEWGLKYIVRGDILLLDGTTVTLNELCDEIGIAHLPYLEEMSTRIAN